eukprot:9290526-Pyramimonas_sp.AAC.1
MYPSGTLLCNGCFGLDPRHLQGAQCGSRNRSGRGGGSGGVRGARPIVRSAVDGFARAAPHAG